MALILSQHTSFSPSCIKHCLTVHDTAFICAEIAAKQGHGDVSMLTPTNIAIEVLYSFFIHVQLFNWRTVFWPQILFPPNVKSC